MTTTPFDARVAALDAGALTELMRGRHSVRAFTDRPIEGAVQQRFRFELLEDGRTVAPAPCRRSPAERSTSASPGFTSSWVPTRSRDWAFER